MPASSAPQAPTASSATQPPAPTFGPFGGGGQAPPPPAFVKRLRDPGPPPPPRRFALAALALALFAGLLVAEQPAGLALAVLGVGLAAAAWGLVDTPRRDRSTAVLLTAAGVLGAVPAVRDSGWVVTLSLLGALTLASIAVAGARTWREVGSALAAWAIKLFPAPGMFFGAGIRRAASRRWSFAGPVTRGLSLGTLLVLLFGALFSAADEQFAQLVRELFDWNLDLASVTGRALVFALTLAIAGALWLVAVARQDRPARAPSTRLGATEWRIALGAVVAVFAGFVVLQLGVFFGGDDFVQLTDGLTYAENARRGFGQLTLAAMLTLGVVAGARHAGPADDRTVRALSGVLCLLTIVVLASALYRLGLYVDAYGQSRTRLSMTSLMLWLGAVLLLVAMLGGLRRTAWLPRAIVLTSAAFAIGTVALNPDGRVAEQNVQRYAETGRIDLDYLATLSADAIPSLRALPAPLRSCVTRSIAAQTLGGARRDSLPGLNVGRLRARDVTQQRSGRSPASIPPAGQRCG